MRTSLATLAAFLVLLIPSPLSAQYWGERVMEKGFEQTEFFFAPGYLVPYGIGSFKTTTPGLLADPLLDVIVNPARLASDSLHDHYLYTDLRSAREVKDKNIGIYPAWQMYDSRMALNTMYYPGFYLRNRRELEPVFSGAYVGRPLPSAAPALALGVTYQLVMQDDRYYSIPQDIYRSVLGYDYNGVRAAAESIPIVDKYSGEDNIHQSGHFINAFARYALPIGLTVGIKAGRVMFGRDGSYGSSNLWGHSPSATEHSLYANMETRDQAYAHWDLVAGVEYRLAEHATLGATAGYLWGDATQSLNNSDTAYYVSSSNSWNSFYNRSANSFRDWRHHGKTFLASAGITSAAAAGVTLTLLYRYQHERVNIGLGSAIQDTSYSTHTWIDAGTTTSRRSYSRSFLSDMRDGSGRRTTTYHHFQASVRWKMDEKLTLATGVQLNWQNGLTRTREHVLMASRSAYWDDPLRWSYQYADDALKDLLWDFSVERVNFQVPIFVTITASPSVEVLLGLNRNMARWEIEDVTLALFAYRRSLQDGTMTEKRNFGERYTAPKEEVTDVRTTFLAGLTLSPSQKFHVRMLMVPNFHDTFEGSELEQIQWWVGITVTP